MPKVLISDSLSPAAVKIFEQRGIETDIKIGLKPDELKDIIGNYDGLAIRSATKVTADILGAAKNLKVVGRAGIGVDNVDVPAATARGVIVMNTPFGNSITTAEHAIAMMFALARQLPAANASTHAGKWEKSRFMGVEVTGKTLGIVGCGNIGSIVAERALGLKMKVVTYDPFLTPERAQKMGVEKVELDQLWPRADFITLHTPMTDATRGIVNAAALGKCKKGVYIINCARGGLVVEADLQAALESGHVAGAALDVFAEEPAKQHPLFGNEKVVCTPHLGASTTEAQENVALQVAEQMSDYLLTGAVTNALNMPSVSAEDAPKLRPYLGLAAQIGAFAGQITGSAISAVTLEYEGDVATLNTRPITNMIVMGLLRPSMDSVNMVNAPVVAKERGIKISETTNNNSGDFHTLIRLTVESADGATVLAGSLFSGKPRLIAINDVTLEAELTPHMLFVRNQDKPGFIGRLGTLLGEAGINIANFMLGRNAPGADAVCLVAVDGDIPPAMQDRVKALPGVVSAFALAFAA
ncbi:MAG: phosphoglycerate dehydrogenase [Alphaproteobacteria bacterium]|nr:phosphoglycerate dehydrogenase [Alphaproteobacteria bacterium]